MVVVNSGAVAPEADVHVKATVTPYGRAAVEVLATQVHQAKAGEPLAPVTVVVASNAAAVAARRSLASTGGGIANVTFLTLHRLAERLGASRLARAGRLPVSAPVLGAAVRSVLAEAPGVFAQVADHPATEQALVTAHRELTSVPEAGLTAVAACSPRAADVVRIHRAVRSILRDGWHEEHDLLVAAADELRAAGRHDLGPVIVHLLQDLRPAEAHLLRMIAVTGPLQVNVGVTGEPAADAPVVAAHARAGIEVPAERRIRPGSATRIVSASDPDEEVRASIRLVCDWMHDGVNLGRIGLLYGMAEPYARLLHEQLAAAAIPFNGAPLTEVGNLLLGRTLRALLALPDGGFGRFDVLGVLTGAPLLDGGRRLPVREWERFSREAGVVGGDDWDDRLRALAAGKRAEAGPREADAEDDWRAGRLRREADSIDAFRTFVGRLRQDLDRSSSVGSWGELVAWVKGLIGTYLGDERRRVRWPEDERRAAERVEAALDRLAGLDALPGAPPTLDVFRRALDRELDLTLGRVGRLGDGVLVGPVSVASDLAFDRVVVLGMAEGIFPSRRLEDSLLPDAERAAAGGTLSFRADRMHDDHRHLLAAVASADEAVLCHARGDLRRSGERPASRWLLADAAKLAGVARLRSDDLTAHAGEAWLHVVPSFAGGLALLSRPATEQELRLAAVARGTGDHAALVDDHGLVSALEVVGARRSDRFTRFDGNLAAIAEEIDPPVRVSATRLQKWAACPHEYLLHYLLDVDPVEEPERRFAISALDKGSLIHEILEVFLVDALEGSHPLDRWTAADHERLDVVAERHFADYEVAGLTGRALLWRRDRAGILAGLHEFLKRDSARLERGFRPLGAEHVFSGLQVPLAGGHVLVVGGSVDRVDRRPDGSLVVLDYKTGSAKSYLKLSAHDPHGGGQKLQLFLYARAAEAAFPTTEPVHAAYWFNTEAGEFREVGYDVTPEVAAEVTAAIEAIVEGIRGGVFPARPTPPSSRLSYVDCWYCTPDGLSGADRHREWVHKRLDPALVGFVGLAEPEVLLDSP